MPLGWDSGYCLGRHRGLGGQILRRTSEQSYDARVISIGALSQLEELLGACVSVKMVCENRHERTMETS